jgi:hypothetical protein
VGSGLPAHAFLPPAQVYGPAALHRALRRAARGHRDCPDVARWLLEAGPRLCALSAALLGEQWRPGPLRRFEIREPKPRVVVEAAFEDRVVHHALVGELERVLDPTLDPQSYACRRGQGLHRCVLQAQRCARAHPYVLGLDIQGYFAQLGHDFLLSLLAARAVPEVSLRLVARILAAGAPVSAVGEARGVPIGLLTSQFLGNLALDPLERHLRRELPHLDHVRYMDDILLFGPSKPLLWRAHAWCRELLATWDLRLKERATRLRPCAEGIDFLGLRVFPELIRPDRAARQRFVQRVRHLAGRRCSTDAAEAARQAGLETLFAHMSFGETIGLRRSLVLDLWPSGG